VVRASITADTIVAPDGTLTGDKIVENTDSNTHYSLRSSVSITAGTSYAYSVFFKKGERTSAGIILRPNNLADQAVSVFFDLVSFTVLSASAIGSSVLVGNSVKEVGNGWVRAEVAFSHPSATTVNIWNMPSIGTTQSYQGDGYSGIYIWGAQLE
jgi:hypothetical protein